VTILFDTGTGNKKRLIDITKLAQQYQQELCTALLGLSNVSLVEQHFPLILL
jgi:hypothetical protein